MAAKNLYLTATTNGGWRTVDEATQTAANTADGWEVGTGATNHSEYAVGVERAATTFVGTTVPDGSIDTTLKDCFRSTNAYSGDFASANWEFHFVLRAVTNGGAQDGRVRFRLFKANADGSSATEITSAQQLGSLVANVSTSADFDSTLTFNPGAFSVANQYLFVQLAWERTGAGGMTSSDITFRTGSSSTVGTRIITSDFTLSTVTGNLASTIAVPTGSIGGNSVAGGHTATIAVPTGSIGAAHGVAVTAASTIAVPTGSIGSAHGVAASLSSTLAAPTGSLEASHGVAGTLASTLAAPTGSLGGNSVAGGLASTLLAPTGSLGAAHGAAGAMSASLPAPSSAMAGSSTVGSLAATLGAPTGNIAAEHTAGGAVTGSFSGTLSVPTGTVGAAHGVAISSTATMMPAPTSSVAVAHGVAGTLSSTLVVPTPSATAAHGVAGSVSATLSLPTSSAQVTASNPASPSPISLVLEARPSLVRALDSLRTLTASEVRTIAVRDSNNKRSAP